MQSNAISTYPEHGTVNSTSVEVRLDAEEDEEHSV